MKKSKKGFTLTELMIVVAIIVIISAAGMAGIAIAVQDADKRGQKIQQLHGEGNWEAAANQKIKDNVPTLGPQDVYEESLDTPSTSTPTPTATDKPESTPTSTPASTPKPTTTPASTPKPTTTPASTPKPTTTPASTPKPTTQPTSGGNTQTLNVAMQPNSSTYIDVDESKTIKSITINWEKNATTNGSFNISYEQSNGYNYYGASQGVQTGYGVYSGSATIEPQANGQSVNCSKLYFSNPKWNSADVTIVSYTIEYND